MTIRKKSDLEQLISDVHCHHINHHSRELYLHGFYNDVEDVDNGIDYRVATSFVKNLHVLLGQNLTTGVLVYMHTTGGDWSDGMAIFNAMRFASVPITMVAYSQVYSMGGIILQAADRRLLAPDCELMIHYGSISVSDSSKAVKSVVDTNEKNSKRMLEIFARRALKSSKYFKDGKYTEAKISAYIDAKIKNSGDWYMSAEEAVHYGFADGVIGGKGYETVERLRCKTKFKGNL